METLKKLTYLLMIITLINISADAQEYDDLYFNAKDRKDQENKSKTKTPGKVVQDSNNTFNDAYSAQNVNPEYLSRYQSEQPDVYLGDDEFDPDVIYPTPSYSTISYYNEQTADTLIDEQGQTTIINNYYNTEPYYDNSYDNSYSNSNWNNNWNSWNGWYNPWRYRSGFYYDPWYGGWGGNWSISFGNSWGWGSWYDPWYSPYYYDSWYWGGSYWGNSWYGYRRPYYSGYYGWNRYNYGYSNGYYDGFYSGSSYGNSYANSPRKRVTEGTRNSRGGVVTSTNSSRSRSSAANQSYNSNPSARTSSSQNAYYSRSRSGSTGSNSEYSSRSRSTSARTGSSSSRTYSSAGTSRNSSSGRNSSTYSSSRSRTSTPNYSNNTSRSSNSNSRYSQSSGAVLQPEADQHIVAILPELIVQVVHHQAATHPDRILVEVAADHLPAEVTVRDQIRAVVPDLIAAEAAVGLHLVPAGVIRVADLLRDHILVEAQADPQAHTLVDRAAEVPIQEAPVDHPDHIQVVDLVAVVQGLHIQEEVQADHQVPGDHLLAVEVVHQDQEAADSFLSF